MTDSNKTFTYYDILGIRKDANQETIRAAYRTMAKKLHPDMGGSAESMNMLTRAYGVLSSPDKRRRYDETLQRSAGTSQDTHAGNKQSTSHQPSAEDLLEQERKLVREVRRAAAKSIWIGLALAFVGTLVTALTYNAASSGGTYFFAWGPILFGCIYIIRGMFNALSPYSVLRKAFDSAGYKHKFYLEKSGQPVRAVFAIIAIVVGIFLIIGWIGSPASEGDNSSSSASSSTNQSLVLKQRYDSCIEDFRGIESELTSVNNQMSDYKTQGYISLYNNLVDKQNGLASLYKTKYDECEVYRTQYNDSLKN